MRAFAEFYYYPVTLISAVCVCFGILRNYCDDYYDDITITHRWDKMYWISCV